MRKLFWLLFAANTAIIASAIYLLSQDKEDEETYNTSLANPWAIVTKDTILKKIANAFVVDAKYQPMYLLNEYLGLAETRFTDIETGIEWNVRVQKTNKAEDISGMYYCWNDDNNGFTKEVEVDGVTYRQLSCYSEGTNIYVAYGYKDGYTICYSCISEDENISIPVLQ